MQDPRALMNPTNLESYRAWGLEGVRRSGFGAILTLVTVLTPALTLAGIVFRPTAPQARPWLVFIAAGFAAYIVVAVGLMVFAMLRLNAWKRAHPWEPPASSLRWK